MFKWLVFNIKPYLCSNSMLNLDNNLSVGYKDRRASQTQPVNVLFYLQRVV